MNVNIGTLIGDRYEIIEKIGTGGMADVFRARDHRLNRFVAVKILKNEYSEDTKFVAKFRQEAQAIACLSHPNVVGVYDVGEEDEMRTHPNKNIITRALGTDTAVQMDCFEIEVQEGDVLLLCSDGLSNMLEDEEIEKIIREHITDMKSAGECLVERANEAGGKDNISVVLVRL